jgi:deferrochelatase/peroxidase EfeB
MRRKNNDRLRASRRGFLTTTAGLVAAAGTGALDAKAAQPRTRTEPFWGEHQGGIVTPVQSHSYFAAFDLITEKRDEVADLLRVWTQAASRMAEGKTAQPLQGGLKPVVDKDNKSANAKNYESYANMNLTAVAADSGEVLGLSPERLTVTFGFGAGLFSKDGNDRYGLATRRPQPLIDMPRFVGDQLVEGHTGGDLSVQACADDPQIAFHAVRQCARLGAEVAKLRWAQTGFVANYAAGNTPRNLMGFRDGTVNPPVADPQAMAKFIWVGPEGPNWMRGGSYLIVRRIRIAIEHWDRMKTAFQEQTIGRHKYSGAPLGKSKEFDSLDLTASDKDGNPLIPENAHVRLAAAASNDGAQFLRRPYSYNNGIDFTAERWPPWRQGLEYDAGLFFIAYQRDPRTGFVKIYDRMSKLDMMNQFVTHVGSGLFACPCGAMPGGFIGSELFEAA